MTDAVKDKGSITAIDGLPDYVMAYRLKGEMDAGVYKDQIIPAVQKAIKAHGKMNVLLVLDKDEAHYDMSGVREELSLDTHHYKETGKVAVVTNSKACSAAIHSIAWMFPNKVHVYGLDEMDAAKKFVSEKPE